MRNRAIEKNQFVHSQPKRFLFALLFVNKADAAVINEHHFHALMSVNFHFKIVPVFLIVTLGKFYIFIHITLCKRLFQNTPLVPSFFPTATGAPPASLEASAANAILWLRTELFRNVIRGRVCPLLIKARTSLIICTSPPP